ncbi:uncharacterized protein LOC112236047 isoform X1 [Oncorhynchus tshawytscha]|uniref:Uncharacterized protein n=3 Tax=Oncorhynchus tshawytscha TaxID=74940 RepID=A0AAZ3QS27_ONCTS|nr:uncharacterized protein LOC112236047 isoform X1 [Oncorhynchus tshawytscha]XP_024260395.2 uncharacterized protein LOC112236047 isoform X1 [Oncorhynchus tshawytscha]XP_024260396.2 uncharacterized protein LOC112236047 isoform X1 [Oncorhynchus tshawytscha]
METLGSKREMALPSRSSSQAIGALTLSSSQVIGAPTVSSSQAIGALTLSSSQAIGAQTVSSSQVIGAPPLRNFTIPRRKRGDGKALLDVCLKESRDYSLIQTTLNESRLDMGKEISFSWQWDDVTLIHNEELLREFFEKRSEMRLKDRHVREMEERFCFLVTSDQKAKQMYQHGLKVENTDQHSLGNPSYGVYLHRHADVALKNISGNTPAGKILIIFKVLFGKVKKVPPCYGRNSTHDPTVNYDCHVSKDPAVPRDSLSQQVLSSSVFLFDYNENQELKQRPRQCLPYAMVSLVPSVNSSPTSTLVPSVKLGPKTKDSAACLETCTVAQRVGRGQNATVTFKHFGTTESPLPGYRSQGFGTNPPFQRGDQQNFQNITSIANQLYHNGSDQPPPPPLHISPCDQPPPPPPPLGPCDQPPPPFSPCDQSPAPISPCDQPPTPFSSCVQPPSPFSSCVQPPSPFSSCVQPPSPFSSCVQPPSPFSSCVQPPLPFSSCVQPPSPFSSCVQPPSPFSSCAQLLPPFSSCVQPTPSPSPFSPCDQPPPPFSSWAPPLPPPFTGSITFLEDNGLVTDPIHLQIPSHAGTAQFDHNKPHLCNQVQSCQQVSNTLSTNQDNLWRQSTSATGALEPVSTIVYSSRVIKDPRLSARDTNNMQRSISMESESGQQTSTSVCILTVKPEHKNLQNVPKQEKNLRETGKKNDPKPCQPDTPIDCSTATLVNISAPSSVIPTTENQPSSRMLKMKFQKYSPYFHLTKEERKAKIGSLQHLSFDEKNTLLERTNFYATYFQKSRCLLNQNDKVTAVDPGRLCKPGSIKRCLSSTEKTQKTHDDSGAYLQQQVRQHNLPQYTTNGDQSSKPIPEISAHNPSIVCGAVEENVALQFERNTGNMEPEDMNLCSPESTTTCLTETEEDVHKVTVEPQDEMAMKNDSPIPFLPQTVNQTATSESRQETEVRSNLNSATEEKPQDALNENSNASKQNTEASSKPNSIRYEKNLNIVPEIAEGNRQSRELKCEPILAEKNKTNAVSSVDDTMVNENPSETRCPVIYESHTDIMDACEEVCGTGTSEEVMSVTVFCPGVMSRQNHERLLQKDRECYGIGQHQQNESNTFSTCGDLADNTEECQADDSKAKDTVYSFLYNRLQLSELFLSPNQHGSCSISGKHYLKPKCKDSPMDTNKSLLPSCNPNQVDIGEGFNLRITINADRELSAVTESPSLSKRFSVSECPQGTQASTTVQENEKFSNNSMISENTPIDGVLKTSTYYTTFNRAHARNAKLIKMMAEKYKGKENASVRIMRNHQHSRVKKKLIVEKSTTDIPYSEISRSSHKAITGHMQMPFMQREKDCLNVSHKNLKRKTFFPNKVTRNARENKHKSCFTFKSKVAAHKMSVSDDLKTSTRVPITSKKSTILKTIIDFRRKKRWGTFNHNRMYSQRNVWNAPAKYITSSPTSDDNKHLRGNRFEKKHLKTPTRGLETNMSMRDGNEKINEEKQIADAVDTTLTSSTIDIVNEEAAKSNYGSTASNFVEDIQHIEEAKDLSKSRTSNDGKPHDTETSQETQSNCTSLQNKLPPPKCTNIVAISQDNEGMTEFKKHEVDLLKEKALQAHTHSIKEVEEANSDMAPAKEIISASENMEFPLDAAIKILCGSELISNTPKPQEEIARVLQHKYGQMETEKADTSDRTHYCNPLEQEDTPSKEVKLINRLRDYLTNFEYIVRKPEPKTSDTLCETETNLPQICETIQNNVNDHKEKPVHLVVLDRVELRNLRPNAIPFPIKICTPNINTNNDLIHSKEQEHKEKTRGNKTNYYRIPCISPDSTSMLEVPEKSTQTPMDKKTTEAEISTSVPDINHGITIAENDASREQQRQPNYTIDANNMIMLKALAEIEPENSEFCKTKENTNQKPTSHIVRVNTKTFHRNFSVADISNALKHGDKVTSLAELCPLRTECKVMMQYFILNFEEKQNVEVNSTIVSRDQILERYLDRPPVPMELKYEALNSFLELQIMMEAWQFVDNKMRFLSGQSTFRSLLWYDPTLYGELFKGKVGLQQQSSLYSSFQQSLINEGPIALQRYHLAVSTLNEQLKRAPEMSYYMYLKSKRERLEIEAALRNPSDIESFFLSVPLSCMVNFGDSVESLQGVQRLVTTFTETPADKLEDGFDVGKAEHLAMVFRFLQEKIYYLKACSNTMVSKTSWFGMEHIMYDASKMLVWRNTKQTGSDELQAKYKKANPQIVFGVTESGVSLLHTSVSKRTQLMVKTGTTAQRFRGRSRGRPPMENTRCAEKKYPQHGSLPIIDLTKSPNRDNPDVYHWATPPSNPAGHFQAWTHQESLVKSQVVNWGERSHDTQAMERNIPASSLSRPVPTYPEIRACLRTSKSGTAPNSQIQLPASMGGVGSKSDGRQQWAVSWVPHNPQNITGSDLRPMHPLWIGVGDNGHPPIGEPVLLEQTNPSSWSSLPSSPPSVPAGNTAQQSLHSLPALATTTNNFPPICEPLPINYPFFLLNGQTYSTANPELSTATLDNRGRFPRYVE